MTRIDVSHAGSLPSPDDLFNYEVIVLQQPSGRSWLNVVRQLQDRGVRVLFEVDDYIQGARKTKSHELSDIYDEKFVQKMELVMRVCDGMIVTTDFLARRYRSFDFNACTALPDGMRTRIQLGLRSTGASANSTGDRPIFWSATWRAPGSSEAEPWATTASGMVRGVLLMAGYSWA